MKLFKRDNKKDDFIDEIERLEDAINIEIAIQSNRCDTKHRRGSLSALISIQRVLQTALERLEE